PFEDDTNSILLLDRFCPDNSHETMLDNLLLKETLKSLDNRDKKIILLRFFRDKTQSEIAKVLGVSQVQVSRLENKILEKLKEKLSS
ncbi:MAG: sigma-70 family RNA polymerase sigma factor, partial [Clostridia bacterium]|nr:sigma-70 family RNA polymerase sigma factor [Clostridia bacterium]